MLKKILTRKRRIFCALMLIVIAGALGAISIIDGIITSEKKDEKESVESTIDRVLATSKMVADEYALNRKLARETVERQLNREAVTLVGDLQVFLQSALIKKEADIAQQNLKEVRRKRELLAAFALQRFSSMTKEMLRLKQDVSRMQIGIDDLVEDAQKKVNAESTLLDSDLLGSTAELPDILSQIRNKNIENSKSFRERGRINAKSEVLKLKELRKFLDDKKVQSRVDPVKFFRDLSPDIANMLPANTTFTISEAGGRVLLSLGSDEVQQNAISTEVTRPMLLKVMGESYQWMLKVNLSSDAVESITVAELGKILEGHISRVLDSRDYSTYIFGEDNKLVRLFPKNAGMKTSIPELGWKEILAANISTFYKSKEFELAGMAYSIGICYEMKHVSVEERVKKIIEENPSNAVLLVLVLILILAAIVLVGVIGWRNEEGRVVYDRTQDSAKIDIRSIKPELGSLKRLQSMNRGHSVGGSRILDFTRNDALKELVGRVRNDNGSGENNELAGKPATHKAGLREYMK